MWGQLAFDTEVMGTLQRINPKVSLLIQIEAFFPMMTIIIAFLTRLGFFQFLTNNANLLFCIESNQVQIIVFHRFLASLGVFDISVHREIQKEPCPSKIGRYCNTQIQQKEENSPISFRKR